MAIHLRLIFGVAACLQMYTPLKALVPFISSIRNLSKDREVVNLLVIRRIVRSLDDRDADLPTTTLQPSFIAFLTDTSQSGPYSITLEAAHKEMANVCLRVMSAELRFNIFGLSSSDLSHLGIDSAGLIQSNISLQLQYACQFWTYHVSQVKNHDSKLVQEISGFFKTHFLAWLEIMSMMTCSPQDAMANLYSIQVSLHVKSHS